MEKRSDYAHFSNGFWKVCWDLSKAFPTAVHDVVTTGAGSRAVQDTAGWSHKGLVTCKGKHNILHLLERFKAELLK